MREESQARRRLRRIIQYTNWYQVSFLAYVLTGIVTYGYAASNARCWQSGSYIVCETSRIAISSLAAAVAWPLYWSWVWFGGESVFYS